MGGTNRSEPADSGAPEKVDAASLLNHWQQYRSAQEDAPDEADTEPSAPASEFSGPGDDESAFGALPEAFLAIRPLRHETDAKAAEEPFEAVDPGISLPVHHDRRARRSDPENGPPQPANPEPGPEQEPEPQPQPDAAPEPEPEPAHEVTFYDQLIAARAATAQREAEAQAQAKVQALAEAHAHAEAETRARADAQAAAAERRSDPAGGVFVQPGSALDDWIQRRKGKNPVRSDAPFEVEPGPRETSSPAPGFVVQSGSAVDDWIQQRKGRNPVRSDVRPEDAPPEHPPEQQTPAGPAVPFDFSWFNPPPPAVRPAAASGPEPQPEAAISGSAPVTSGSIPAGRPRSGRVKPAKRPFIPPPVIGWREGGDQREDQAEDETPYAASDDAQTTETEPTPEPAAPVGPPPASPSAARARREATSNRVATSGHWRSPRTPRLVLGLLFLAAAAATVRLAMTAYHLRTEANIGIAGAVLAFTLIFWWALVAWSITRTSIENGILLVTRGESDRFDLRMPGLDIQVHGEPDSKKWKVTIGRHQLDPCVITPRMVDPEEFMAILEHYRGRPRAQAEPDRPQLLITPSRLAR